MKQTCCGLPLFSVSEENAARDLAARNIEAFSNIDCDHIVTLCASCASHLKNHYIKMFRPGSTVHKKIEIFAGKVIDFSSFMANVLKVSPPEFRRSKKKAAYHSPCHLCRGLNVTKEPRKLIEIAGFTYVPSKDEDVCCGFGGSYSMDFPEISSEILRKKLDNVEESETEILLTDCPGCVMQLRRGMDKREKRIQVRHIAEAMAEQRI